MNLFKKVMQMKNKKAPKQLRVVSSERISESFQRVVVNGEALSTLPGDCAGQYIKLLFAEDGSSDLSNLEPGNKPSMRTYTIREFDAQNLLLTIDFVIHEAEHGGQASRWALNAAEGDVLTIAGPGPIQEVSSDADGYLFVADMTALPAAAVAIERLPNTARGKAFIQVSSESDIQSIATPKGLDVEWLIADATIASLAESIEALPALEANTAIWCASEFGQMRRVRRTLSDQVNFNRNLSYFSSYWKPGVTEDGHKKLKQEDAKTF
jgi:NADPH-dependent ferric siderophore reductase